MNKPVAILDHRGRPLPPANRSARADGSNYPSGMTGGYGNSYSYESAEQQTQEMGNWLPWIRSPDSEINLYRDRMVARNRDLVRNDGWASGSVMRILDNTVGAVLRLHSSPDYSALQRYSASFDAVWADEFRRVVEARWRNYWYDVGHYNDVEREITGGEQFRLALRHKLIDGDSMMVSYWLPERVGRGAAKYATAFQVVDPDRLSNPYQAIDSKYMRGGVEIDALGERIAYHIRKAEQNDWYNVSESMTWERVEREDPDGWRRIIHDFEHDRAGQHRGIGIFTPVLARMKMLARYYGTELQAAVIAASLGTYITSPYDPALVQDAIDDSADELNAYQSLRSDWADKRPALFAGARVPTLAPGEKIEQVSGAHPHAEFTPFAQEMLRTFASSAGLSTEQVTQDWSKSNYSNLKGALRESEKTLNRRQSQFYAGTATPVFSIWLQEEFERGELPLPSGAPDYIEARTEYSRCNWLGPGRGFVDVTKEKQGAQMGMEIGISTLQRECAEQGLDWEDVLTQRRIELKKFEELGLPIPEWGAAMEQPGGEKEGSHGPSSPNYRSS